MLEATHELMLYVVSSRQLCSHLLSCPFYMPVLHIPKPGDILLHSLKVVMLCLATLSLAVCDLLTSHLLVKSNM